MGANWYGRALGPLVLVLLVVAPFLLDDTTLGLVTSILIYSIFAMGFDLLYGYSGIVSFGHAAFFGLGAYVFAIVANQFSLTLVWPSLIAAILFTTVVALLAGWLFARTQDTYFAILTLAFAQITVIVVQNLGITGGSNGFSLALTQLQIVPGVLEYSLFDVGAFYYFVAGLAVLTFFFLWRLVNSPLGEVLKGIRTNPERVKYLGYSAYTYRVFAFSVSCGIAALAGTLEAMRIAYISPSVMDFMFSGEVIVWTIIGGKGTLVGPVVGTGLARFAEDTLSQYVTWWLVPLGILFILIVIYMPDGIVGRVRNLRGWLSDRRE